PMSFGGDEFATPLLQIWRIIRCKHQPRHPPERGRRHQPLADLLLVAGLVRRVPDGGLDLPRRPPDGRRPGGDRGRGVEDGRRARRSPGRPGPPPGARLPADRATGAALQPRLRMAAGNGPGMIFVTILCLVIVITNIHLRGLWSVIAILGVV